DGVYRHAAAFPDLLAGSQVVAADAASAIHNDLRFAFVGDDQRRGPGRLLFTRGAPARGAGGGVQTNERGVLLLIIIEQQVVAVNDRRDRFAPTQTRVEPAQVALPNRFAVKRIAKRPE